MKICMPISEEVTDAAVAAAIQKICMLLSEKGTAASVAAAAHVYF